MECASCRAELNEGSRFCDACGAPVPSRCPACGAANRQGAKFCATCGSALAAGGTQERAATASPDPPAARAALAERRQLTVMFCDLVGSTALAARLDPEDLREVISPYQRCVTETVERFEGCVAKYMGDGVLAYFGWPRAHEDDAERAVRAGLAIALAVGRLATPAGETLAVRIGIATGLVMVGELIGAGGAREETVVGETPNLAARLQALAGPGGVAISQTTRRLVGRLFELADLGPLSIAGFAGPVPVWRVLGEGRAEGRFAALHEAAGLSPLVGRDEELELLHRQWRKAKAGEGQVALIAGEPGIGKSRLVSALRQRLADEPYTALSHFCSPFFQSSALHPVVVHLERAAGFRRDDSDDERLDKVERLLVRGIGDVAAAMPLIAALLGIPTGARYPPLELSPQRQKHLTFEVLARQMEGLAQAQPMLVLFEDVHWIDPSTQELLDLLVERIATLPVLVLITYRPEYRPPWIGHDRVRLMALSRLGRHEGAALAQQVTQGKALPPTVLEQIVAKTDGVPLFVEELTRTVVESGLLTDAGDRYAMAGPLPPLAIPATLHDSLLARLDRLAPVKEVAQIGAVLGREFSHELLAAVVRLGEDELRDALDRLVASELVFRRGTPPEATYIFKHALVQDAAYQSLLKSRRQQLHARVADAIEGGFAHIAETQPEVLAHHCTEAGLHQKAVLYWQRAAGIAVQRSAMAEALGHLTRSLELLARLPVGRDRDCLELDLRIALGRVLISTKGWAAPEVAEAYERARELCDEEAQHSQLLAAVSGLQAHHLHRAGAGVGLKVAEELFALTERQRHANRQAAGHQVMGVCLLFRGQLSPALAHFEQALALFDPADRASIEDMARADIRVAGLCFMALIHLWQGYADRGLVRGEEALAAAEELRHGFSTSQALYLTCWLHQVRGEWPVVRQRAEALMTFAAEHGFTAWSASATILHGWAVADSGAAQPGISEMHRGLEEKRALGLQQHMPCLLGLLAGVYMKDDDPDEALGLVDDALARVERLDERWFESELHRLKGEALLRLSADQPEQAEACFQCAIAVAKAQGAKWWELRASVSLARLYAERGNERRGHEVLAPVYDWFTEGFDTTDLQAARALLQELGPPAAE